jgi:hypothetical protein
MKRKRKNKSNEAILKDFAQEVTANEEIAKFLLDPTGEVSMSDAISQLIEPFRNDAPDYDGFRNLVTFGCIAWNASNLPTEEQDDLINKMLAAVPRSVEDRLELLGLITELMDRKKNLFPKISRMIVDFKVTDQGKNFHIAIASTLEKKGAQE